MEQKNESSIVIVRFMGTSKFSSDINSVFYSIQEQLEIVCKIDECDEKYKKNNNLASKLFYISENHFKKNRKLLIVLDSIDRLSKENYNLNWLFTRLPKHVKIILSSLSNYENIIDNLKKKSMMRIYLN
jgi:hypothetical protein